MSDSPSLQSRSPGRLQSSVERAIKRPVKEAVREALAEGVQREGDETERDAVSAESRQIEVDPADLADGAADADAADEGTAESQTRSGTASRLRSRRALSLGLVALLAYLRRRRRSSSSSEA